MYETYHYGERINEKAISISGKMSCGTFGGSSVLAVRDCSDYDCRCPLQYALYEVGKSSDTNVMSRF